MKKIVTIVLMFVGMQICTNAQTAEEIVKTYLENIGGEEALRKIKNAKMLAKVDAQGMSFPMEMTFTSDGKTINKLEFQGKEMVQQAFDGKVCWGINMMTQKAEKSDDETTENIKRESKDFPDPFLDYEKKGYKIELLGNETIEGAECFKVKLIKTPLLADGKDVDNVVYYYFDVEDFVPIVSETEIKSGPMKGSIAQTIYSNYQEVDGVYFPFSIGSGIKGGPNQPIVIEKIEINADLDDAIFKFPEASE